MCVQYKKLFAKRAMMGTDLKIRRITISTLLVALVCVSICLGHVLRAMLALGYWPTYGNSDPKQLGGSFITRSSCLA